MRLKEALSASASERLNGSFNKSGINNPKKSFYTAKYAGKFPIRGLQGDIYLKFGVWLNDELKRDGIFKRNEDNIMEYFSLIANSWSLIDRDVDASIDERIIYLVKKFVIDPINGKIAEEKFRSFMETQGINLIDSTPEEDAEQCIDFWWKEKDVAFQVKPISFFKSLKGRSESSLKKIWNASLKYENTIFFVNVLNDEIRFVVFDKKTRGFRYEVFDTFIKLFNLPQETIKKYGQRIFQSML